MLGCVFDTNIIISASITSPSNAQKVIDWALSNAKIYVDEVLWREIHNVLSREKFDRYVAYEKRFDLVNRMGNFIEFTKHNLTVDLCRDPKDNMVLACAQAAKADYIITGDQDLLVLQQFEGSKIITLTDFLQIIA